MAERTSLRRVAFVSDYIPRQCGIATFTADLAEALAGEFPETTFFVVPVNDTEIGYPYPPRVRFEIFENDIDSYHRAADYLNINSVDLACLQHEYGIYGGVAGSHFLVLLRELRMPVVTTLHTVLQNPDRHQHRVIEEIGRLSTRVVVMSQKAVDFLEEIYGVPREKIDFIHHGIPDVPFVDPNFYKDRFGVEGRTVVLTFGLLSPNKGIEHVITALPSVVERHPNLVYIVLGSTHPHVLRQEGETYRLCLQRLAQERGVAENVIFFNRYVSLEELVEFIGSADLYITPYLGPDQITSGTLAYALGAGKAVISTPYWYATEMLADGRGMLVPFGDAGALADRMNDLLDNETERHAMRKRAYLFGRQMTWPQVARRYMETFTSAPMERLRFIAPGLAVRALRQRPDEVLPLLKLDHLRNLTDGTGIVQHSIFTVPNYHEGYTTDDNSRALIVTILMEKLGVKPMELIRSMTQRYLAFLWYAFNPKRCRFRNFLGFDRQWMEEVGSDDSHGRTLWALGLVLGRTDSPSFRGFAARLFSQTMAPILDTTSPRGWAFSILGIQEYLRRFAGDRTANQARAQLAARLLENYLTYRAEGWRWFEGELAYCNAVLPHALLLAGQWIPNGTFKEVGLETLDWLAHLQELDSSHFVPIGSKGFHSRGGPKARFDQQPVEAQAMVSACLEAYRITDDPLWMRRARRTFDWFLGWNDLRLPLYDPTTGGCRDGIHPDRVNENQGAESTLAFLHALLELRLMELPIQLEDKP